MSIDWPMVERDIERQRLRGGHPNPVLPDDPANVADPNECPGPFATIIVVITPEGIPIVRDVLRYGVDAQWKFTGGEGRLGETPRQGALREVQEESGIIVPSELLKPYLNPFPRRGYTIYRFVVRLPELPKDGTLKRRADEGEETDVVSPIEICRMADDLINKNPHRDRPFLYFHYDLFVGLFKELVSDEELLKWG